MGKKNHLPQTTQTDEPQAAALPEVAQLNRAFIDTGWRVALGLLLPSFAGIYLDSQQDSKPLYSIIGVAIGLLAVIGVVSATMRHINKDKTS